MEIPQDPRSARKRKTNDHVDLARTNSDLGHDYPKKKIKTLGYNTFVDENAAVGKSCQSKGYEQHAEQSGASIITQGGNVHEELPLKNVSSKKGKKGKKIDGEEKRVRRFRPKAPQMYRDIKERALTQRFYVLDRKRGGTDEVPEEQTTLAGTTGNVYQQQIGKVPKCDCPHGKKGNQCKHLIYLMLRVYKVREEIGYQLALTSSELREIFKDAPIPSAEPASPNSSDPGRKPIEGECPICYAEFELENEKIVYCKAACGNNVHEDCMRRWAQAKSGKATCPYCRARWDDKELPIGLTMNILNGATKSREGYVNIAPQLGISGRRDYSTYHQPWVNQQRRAGAINDEEGL